MCQPATTMAAMFYMTWERLSGLLALMTQISLDGDSGILASGLKSRPSVCRGLSYISKPSAGKIRFPLHPPTPLREPGAMAE